MQVGQLNIRLNAVFAGQQEFQRLGRSLRHVAQETTATGRIMDRFTRMTTGSLRSMAHFLSRQVGNVFRSFFFGIRIWAIMAGAAVSGFVGSSVKAFMEFDKKLRQTTSLIASAQVNAPSNKGSLRQRLQESRRVAEEEYRAYSRSIMRMAAPTARRPTELASGLTEVVSAGFSGKGARQRAMSLSVLRSAAMGAAAGGGDTAEGVRGIANIANSLGLKPTKGASVYMRGDLTPQRIMDRIYQTINYGVGIYFKDVVGTLGNAVGPIGASMGTGPVRGKRGLNELMASLIVGSQRGLSAAKTSIGFTQILDKLIKPTKAGGEFMQSIGITPGTKLLSKGLISEGGALQQIQTALAKKGFSGPKLIEGLRQIFTGDVRAIRLMTTLYNTGLKNVQGVVAMVQKSRGATKAAFDQYQKSLQGITDKFNAMFDVVKIGIGSMLSPYVLSALNQFGDLLDKVSGGEVGQMQMQLYEAAKAKTPGLTAENYAMNIDRKSREAFMTTYRFETAGFRANAARIIRDAAGAVVSYFKSESTQTMLRDSFYSALDGAFGLLGQAAGQAGTVYTFALNLGGTIAMGIVNSLKDALSNLSLSSLFGGGGGGGLGGVSTSGRILALLLGGAATAGFQQRFAAGGSPMSRFGRGAFAMMGGGIAGMPLPFAPMLGALGMMQSGPFDPGMGFYRRLRGRPGRSAEAAIARGILNDSTGGLAFPGMVDRSGNPAAVRHTAEGLLQGPLMQGGGFYSPQQGRFGRLRSGVAGLLSGVIESEFGTLRSGYTRGADGTIMRNGAPARSWPVYQTGVGNSLRKFLRTYTQLGQSTMLEPMYRVRGQFTSPAGLADLQARGPGVATRTMGAPIAGPHGFVPGPSTVSGPYRDASGRFISRATFLQLQDAQRAEIAQYRNVGAMDTRTRTQRLSDMSKMLGASAMMMPIGAFEKGAPFVGRNLARFLKFAGGMKGVAGSAGMLAIPTAMSAMQALNSRGQARKEAMLGMAGTIAGGVGGAILGGPMGAAIGATAGNIMVTGLVGFFKQRDEEQQRRERERQAGKYGASVDSLMRDIGIAQNGLRGPRSAASRQRSAQALRGMAAQIPSFLEKTVQSMSAPGTTGATATLKAPAVVRAQIGKDFIALASPKSSKATVEAAYGHILDAFEGIGADPEFKALVDNTYQKRQLGFTAKAYAKRAQRAAIRERRAAGKGGVNLPLTTAAMVGYIDSMGGVGVGPTQVGYRDAKGFHVGEPPQLKGLKGKDKYFASLKLMDMGYKLGIKVPGSPVGPSLAMPFTFGPNAKAGFVAAGAVPFASFGKGMKKGQKNLKGIITSTTNSVFQDVINAAQRKFGVEINASQAKGGYSGAGGHALTINGKGAKGVIGNFGGNKSRRRKGKGGFDLSGPGGSADDPGSLGGLFNNFGVRSAEQIAERVTRSVVAKQILRPKGPLGRAATGFGWLKAQVGKPYIWGGGHPANTGLNGYDCSGLVSSALMAMGYPMSGTTRDLIYNIDPNRMGPVMLGFNRKTNPSHMGISVFGNWFEAKGRNTPILGPGQARSNWAVTGVPMFHSGGVYRSPRPGGEGLALLKDGERVIPSVTPRGGGHGGGLVINGPLIGHAEVRSDSDVKQIAAELHSLLASRRTNSGRY
jgi:hypothetical protein